MSSGNLVIHIRLGGKNRAQGAYQLTDQRTDWLIFCRVRNFSRFFVLSSNLSRLLISSIPLYVAKMFQNVTLQVVCLWVFQINWIVVLLVNEQFVWKSPFNLYIHLLVVAILNKNRQLAFSLVAWHMLFTWLICALCLKYSIMIHFCRFTLIHILLNHFFLLC